MFVMHFVCPPDCAYILIAASGKPFKPLMNDDIMYNKIRKTVGHDAKTYGLHPPDLVKSSKANEQHAWYCKNHKKRIVLLEEAGLNLVMILVETPKKTVHHIPMGKPGYTFHTNESGKQK